MGNDNNGGGLHLANRDLRCRFKALRDIKQACVPLPSICPESNAEEGPESSCLLYTLKDLWAKIHDAPANCKSARRCVLEMPNAQRQNTGLVEEAK